MSKGIVRYTRERIRNMHRFEFIISVLFILAPYWFFAEFLYIKSYWQDFDLDIYFECNRFSQRVAQSLMIVFKLLFWGMAWLVEIIIKISLYPIWNIIVFRKLIKLRKSKNKKNSNILVG